MNNHYIDFDSVRYTQEYFYPYFSNGRMTVSETYVALSNGFLHPTSLASITIFEHDKQLYCIDTRRLTIAKELQRRKKLEILKCFCIQYVKKNDDQFIDQYFNLVYERLPAMKKKGLNSKTCFAEFKNLNICQCSQCDRRAQINIIKTSNKSYYKFIQNCRCQKFGSQVLYRMEKPWTEVTFQEICDIFMSLRQTLICPDILMKSHMKRVDSKKPSKDVAVLCIQESSHQSSHSYINRNTQEVENNSSIERYCRLEALFNSLIF